MDFELVLKSLLEGFDRLKIRYAALGAFGMGALGVPRATGDLDFLVRRDDLGQLDLLMSSLRYRNILRNDNVSQFQGDDVVWGHVDFIHAFRPLALEMLERALEKPVLAGAHRIRVLQPEDLIAFKVQSMANNPDRRNKELADMELMAETLGKELDWPRLQEHFELFGMRKEFDDLKGRPGPC